MSFLQKLFRPGKPQTSSNPPKAEAEDNIVISVVIPSYNARKTLASTLESLQKSQHTNLDVIVVDVVPKTELKILSTLLKTTVSAIFGKRMPDRDWRGILVLTTQKGNTFSFWTLTMQYIPIP